MIKDMMACREKIDGMTASTTKRNQIDASEDKPPCNKTSKD
jgi:hypothetical protein